MQECLPSRFLEELPEDSLEWFGKTHESREGNSEKMAKSHLDLLKNMLTQS